MSLPIRIIGDIAHVGLSILGRDATGVPDYLTGRQQFAIRKSTRLKTDMNLKQKREIREGEAARLISDAVDSLGGELVEFLQEIVRIPTENPPGKNYPECAKAIGNKMEEAGLAVQYVEVPGELLPVLAPHGEGLPRPSVIGKLAGSKNRPLLHFTGHYDVVPAGDGWSVPPYAADIREGKIFGRGSSDQKSGIASEIFAIKALQGAGLELEGTLVASATPDEETGGFAGLGYLVDRGLLSKENTDFCIITECLDVDKICLGHRGTLWLEVETRGRQSHGSMPSEGVNAVEKMLDLLDAIRHEILPGLEAVSRHPVMPIACRKSSLTTTMIQGGIKTNIVPASCRAHLDWRLIPEQSIAGAKESLLALCRRMEQRDPEFQCQVREIMSVNPTLVPNGTEVVKTLRQAGNLILGEPLGFSISPGSDDQKFVVQNAGLQQCVVYGPGPLAVAHKADEFQPVNDLLAGTKIMALAAWKLVGSH
jgi:succinyl-diaminopimelate desuccinylase